MKYYRKAIYICIALLVFFTGCRSNNQQVIESVSSVEAIGQFTRESQTIIESTTVKQGESNSVEIDYEALSIEELQELANKNDAEAQFQLGRAYNRGEKAEQDYQKAIQWYTKAAEQNHAYAQHNLGVMYIYGEGVQKDYQKAFEWFTKAAEQGDATAQYSLGNMYHNGKGVEQDYQKSIEWYTKAAEQGNDYTQCILGFMYYEGEGVEQDYQKAIEWFTKAAKQGNENANGLLEMIKDEKPELFESTTQEVTTPTNSDNSIIKEGTYKVGKDIPAGEYIVTPEEGRTCYYEVSADSSGDSIITNENVAGQDYITVEDGQYFKIKRGTAKLAE